MAFACRMGLLLRVWVSVCVCPWTDGFPYLFKRSTYRDVPVPRQIGLLIVGHEQEALQTTRCQYSVIVTRCRTVLQDSTVTSMQHICVMLTAHSCFGNFTSYVRQFDHRWTEGHYRFRWFCKMIRLLYLFLSCYTLCTSHMMNATNDVVT